MTNPITAAAYAAVANAFADRVLWRRDGWTCRETENAGNSRLTLSGPKGQTLAYEIIGVSLAALH